MLILSRKRGESIMIGDDIEIQVLDIGDGKIRLGVTGPAWIPVHQRERYEARRRAEKGAARAQTQEILVW
jgi:carbon storage regulator